MINRFFYFLIPPSSAKKIIILPTGQFFINGISKKYSHEFPPLLEGYLKKEEFYLIIEEVNHILETYWSCIPALIIGYLLCIFTFGISLLIPFICINEGVKFIHDYFAKMNFSILNRRGLHISLNKNLIISWIEIKIFDHFEEGVQRELLFDKL